MTRLRLSHVLAVAALGAIGLLASGCCFDFGCGHGGGGGHWGGRHCDLGTGAGTPASAEGVVVACR